MFFSSNPILKDIDSLSVLSKFILKEEISLEVKPQIALTSNQIDFFLPVYPNEKVKVVSEKEYFRFNKLKCAVKMYNEKDELVCRGTISGMVVAKEILK